MKSDKRACALRERVESAWSRDLRGSRTVGVRPYIDPTCMSVESTMDLPGGDRKWLVRVGRVCQGGTARGRAYIRTAIRMRRGQV